MLERVTVTQEDRLSALPLLTEAERHQLLVEWSGPGVESESRVGVYTEAGTEGLAFEAGWRTTGPACLSRWRWQHLPAPCVELNEPIYGNDGGIVNDCRDPNNTYSPGKCSQSCDNAQQAEEHYGARLFNESANNGL